MRCFASRAKTQSQSTEACAPFDAQRECWHWAYFHREVEGELLEDSAFHASRVVHSTSCSRSALEDRERFGANSRRSLTPRGIRTRDGTLLRTPRCIPRVEIISSSTLRGEVLRVFGPRSMALTVLEANNRDSFAVIGEVEGLVDEAGH